MLPHFSKSFKTITILSESTPAHHHVNIYSTYFKSCVDLYLCLKTNTPASPNVSTAVYTVTDFEHHIQKRPLQLGILKQLAHHTQKRTLLTTLLYYIVLLILQHALSLLSFYNVTHPSMYAFNTTVHTVIRFYFQMLL
jgi:hypothetical protein